MRLTRSNLITLLVAGVGILAAIGSGVIITLR